MSYDLALFRVPDLSDAALIYQSILEREENALESQVTPISFDLTEMHRIAQALRTWRPGLVEFSSPELGYIELNDESLQLQFHVSEESVSVTMPYFRSGAQQMMECTTQCFALLRDVAEYTAFDPQLGRVVTEADISEMVKQYRSVNKADLKIMPEITPGAKKPWWKVW